MPTITYDEFKEMPQGAPTKALVVGKKYYISEPKNRKLKVVYKGTFVRENEDKKMFYFEDVENIVSVSHGKPSGYAKSGHIYTEVPAASPKETGSAKSSSSRKSKKSSPLHHPLHDPLHQEEDYLYFYRRGGKKNKRKTAKRKA